MEGEIVLMTDNKKKISREESEQDKKAEVQVVLRQATTE